MALEIERKFLVNGDFKSLAFSKSHIIQGYISTSNGRTVRVRIRDDKGYLTIKGPTNDTGMSRYEWEKEISFDEAKELMALSISSVIDKYRYLVKSGEHIFEVDEFGGDNTGLILAEVELMSEDEEVIIPSFIGKEVTGDSRFYNSHLMKHPFYTFKKLLNLDPE